MTWLVCTKLVSEPERTRVIDPPSLKQKSIIDYIITAAMRLRDAFECGS